MLIHDLTPAQQETFFRAAGLLIAADGRHDQTEVDLLEAALLETALAETPAPAAGVTEIADRLSDLQGSPSARVIGLELAAVVVADGDHDEIELGLLREMAAHLGLANDTVEQMLDVAARTVAVQREALALIAEA